MKKPAALAAALVVLLAAFRLLGSRPVAAPESAPASQATATSVFPGPGPAMTFTPSDSGRGATDPRDAALRAATRLLVRDFSLDANAIKTVSIDEVTWPDSALGCPQPGQMYMQVLTDGFRIVLESDGKQYTVHTGRGDPPAAIRCENPAPGSDVQTR